MKVLYETIPYNGNLTWLKERTIFLTNHGSQAYGTNIADSDLDIKGIVVPPKEYFFGFINHFEQAESKEPDMVIYDIRKFFKLAADCNPSIIEVLWTDESDHRTKTKLGQKVLDNKELFISKKARFTFHGYAISQLKRIQLHRRWLINPLNKKPERCDFELPENHPIPKEQLEAAQSSITKKLDEWNFDDMSGLDPSARLAIKENMANILTNMKINQEEKFSIAARSIGYNENFIRMLDLERQYKSKLNDWNSYQTWKKNRNPKRAALEEKYGYDSKHAGHLVRLMKMCKEILLTGNVIVKRPDREELLSIRNGAWTYEKIIDWADKQDKELNEIYKNSKLPHNPDIKRIDKLCIEIVEQMI